MPEPPSQEGSSGHGAPGELDSLPALPCPPPGTPTRPAVTQFPFPRTPVTQHPTFAWLWEAKQRENSHCWGWESGEKGRCVSTAPAGSSTETLAVFPCVRCTARDPVQGGVQMGRTCCRGSKADRNLEETPCGTLCLLQLHLGDAIWGRGWCCSAGAGVSGCGALMDMVMPTWSPWWQPCIRSCGTDPQSWKHLPALPWDQFWGSLLHSPSLKRLFAPICQQEPMSAFLC